MIFNNKKAYYLIRLDDACPTMKYESWNRIEILLDKYGIKPMVGVIPQNEDQMQKIDPERQDFADLVIQWQKKDWIIAMHGYKHLYEFLEKPQGLHPINTMSEYIGKSYLEQSQLIAAGWKKMNEMGVIPDAFFAPAHSFNEDTVKALKEETPIRVISDTFALSPYFYNDVVFIPVQMGKFRRIIIPGYWTFALHPSQMKDEEEFILFENFIKKNKEHFITFDFAIDKGQKRTLSVFDHLFRNIFVYARNVRKHVNKSFK